MKNESGFQDNKKPEEPWVFTQRGWRKIGLGSVIAAAVMAWLGTDISGAGWSGLQLTVYWLFFLGLLVLAVYTILLDLRFTRLQYMLEEREIFMQTLGSEEFRKELRELQAGDAAGKTESAKDGPDETS